MARRRLFTGRVLLWGAHEVKVDWAEPELAIDGDTMSKVKVLYIRNLALCTTEDDILNLVNAVSAGIERVKKQKDYAFVHFQTREQAELAKQHIDGKIVHGCELEVTWAKPVKNREEYQQRKALARCMVSSTQTNQTFLQQLAPAGILNVPVRRAAGAQGISHSPKMKRPYPSEVLSDICTNNKWGEPQYETFELRGEKGPAYTSKIILPYFPNGPAHFQSDKMSSTAEDSKSDASNYVLRQLGVLQNPGRSINATQGISAASTTPLINPMQALRGPPLTPQYYMAPPLGQMNPLMAPHMAAAAHAAAAASAQGMAMTGMSAGVPGMNPMAGQYLMPTGYESINPLAFQAAAYYMAQPGAFAARYPNTAE